jgi:hypothetical protein
MNRIEEFTELKQELEQLPAALEYTAVKAIARAKKQKRRSILWKTPAVSFCSLIILFVLLVNLFPKAALAMSNVPILKNLVRAVAFDPSLKAAVEHDYYQMVGESQTQEDVTVNVEYMIVDARHISLFFSVDAPVKAGLYHFDMRDPQGRGLSATLVYDTMYKAGELEQILIDFPDESYSIPEEIIFNITVNKDPEFREVMTVTLPAEADSAVQASTPEEKTSGKDYDFSFVLRPDPEYLLAADSIPLKQWVTIKDQRIYLDRLDIYPTKTRLFLDCDEHNSAVLDNLSICFEDEKGEIYDIRGNGITGTFSSDDSQDIDSIYFESSYFSEAKRLTMYIKGISLIEKDKLFGEISFADKTITNLPEDITVASMELNASVLTFILKADTGDPDRQEQLISLEYYDTNDNKYYFTSYHESRYPDDPSYYVEYRIENYEDNKYKLRWLYTIPQTLEEPIKVSIK